MSNNTTAEKIKRITIWGNAGGTNGSAIYCFVCKAKLENSIEYFADFGDDWNIPKRFRNYEVLDKGLSRNGVRYITIAFFKINVRYENKKQI